MHSEVTQKLNSDGFAVIKRFDTTHKLIDRYPSYNYVEDRTSFLHAIYCAAAKRISPYGISPLIMKHESSGRAFSHITPDMKDVKSLGMLRGHTDGAFLSLPGEGEQHEQYNVPELICLYCVRPQGSIKTTVYPLHELQNAVSKNCWSMLSSPLFKINIQHSWQMPKNFSIHNTLRPLIVSHNEINYIRFSHSQVTPTCAESKRALDEFAASIVTAERKITLEPGDLLLIHNQRSIHGRSGSPCPDNIISRRRWLLRFYAKQVDNI